ncbi:MAG TPA: glycoside hydrolase family 97 C-terminal domain-containing protein, partial [Chryseolinea sp.]|nr:glycoside hydrolase family 97 C-terminal domain-containing protein [Chryseolinea sp.]
VIDAAIGKYITTVRKDRNSNDWYLGSITNSEARSIVVALDFLAPGKKYSAEIYQDGKGADMVTNPLPVEITTRTVTASDKFTLALAPGGGTAVRFHQID